ncbi:hypothetical protein D3C86_2101630 [compost metagenome]
MPANAIGGMTPGRIEGLSGQPLYAIELKVARLQLVGQTANKAQFLIFEETPVAGGKHQHLGARMSEY